ncbi:DUF1905 domain-containing protein [Kribbella sp. NPDC058693]|uniref:DUF1905 domain-containing protein n=1 Tax=Kribbella sp. NPDC058693 TaxID=3346602 RepID=UPI0036669FA0
MSTYRFSAPLWQHPGEGSWYFVAVPEQISDDIADLTEGRRKGFGSVRVSVTVGGSTWQTSLFPSKSGSYVLPVKKLVRVAERLAEGAPVEAQLDLVDF